MFCSKWVPIQRPRLVLIAVSKWLLKHYFRWNEKQNQKQSFDWIQGLCWTLPPNSSLPFSTFALWCQLHHFLYYVFGLWTPTLLFLPDLSPSFSCLSSCFFLTLSLPFHHSILSVFISYSQPPSVALDLNSVCSHVLCLSSVCICNERHHCLFYVSLSLSTYIYMYAFFKSALPFIKLVQTPKLNATCKPLT